jgi:hypothetical protein
MPLAVHQTVVVLNLPSQGVGFISPNVIGVKIAVRIVCILRNS